jgi:hypothetical protein
MLNSQACTWETHAELQLCKHQLQKCRHISECKQPIFQNYFVNNQRRPEQSLDASNQLFLQEVSTDQTTSGASLISNKQNCLE